VQEVAAPGWERSGLSQRRPAARCSDTAVEVVRIKTIAVFFLVVLALAVAADAQVCGVKDLRSSLKKALFEYFKSPGSAKLSISEIKDLLVFYLSIDKEKENVNCSVEGDFSGYSINSISTKIENASLVLQRCSDSTVYSRCSDTKPLYCEQGSLISRCDVCGCSGGLVCSSGNCIAETGTNATSGTNVTPSTNVTQNATANASGVKGLGVPIYVGESFFIGGIGYRLEYLNVAAGLENLGFSELDGIPGYSVGVNSQTLKGSVALVDANGRYYRGYILDISSRTYLVITADPNAVVDLYEKRCIYSYPPGASVPNPVPNYVYWGYVDNCPVGDSGCASLGYGTIVPVSCKNQGCMNNTCSSCVSQTIYLANGTAVSLTCPNQNQTAHVPVCLDCYRTQTPLNPYPNNPQCSIVSNCTSADYPNCYAAPYDYLTIQCPNGCRNGACIQSVSNQTTNQTSNTSGLYCGTSTNMDFCSNCYAHGGRVKTGESACWCDSTATYINAWFGSCPAANATAKCRDSDGVSYMTKTTTYTTGWEGNFTDHCVDTRYQWEFYCNADASAHTGLKVDCAIFTAGCNDGRCSPSIQTQYAGIAWNTTDPSCAYWYGNNQPIPNRYGNTPWGYALSCDGQHCGVKRGTSFSDCFGGCLAGACS